MIDPHQDDQCGAVHEHRDARDEPFVHAVAEDAAKTGTHDLEEWDDAGHEGGAPR